MLLPTILILAVLLVALSGFIAFVRRKARGAPPPARPDVDRPRGQESAGRL
ncbi:MAG TPA: hypothetical protein VFP84_13140 [Kofleriaceae bacterium]|nr:hypothetical protein [Kofleriaceae bacterium]